MPSVKRYLLRFREEIVGISVEYEAADPPDGNELLGEELGGVEQVEVKIVLAFLFDDLHAELPLGILTRFDRSQRSRRRKIMRKLRGMARSDIGHIIMCMDTGIREMNGWWMGAPRFRGR